MNHPGPAKQVTYRVRRVHLRVSQFIDDALKPYGLGRSQWQVIVRVRRAGAITQRDLQAILQVEPATLSAIVEALVCKSWLERLENPDDKRGRLLRLAPEAAARLVEIPDPITAVEHRILEGVSEQDLVVVERALDLMIQNLERDRG
ncbi:MAG: MarR family transcriptional regulator [Coriobacteriia bacterium]|nr:MarR family transcriptional regulator [Coriobacteriia bacterium]